MIGNSGRIRKKVVGGRHRGAEGAETSTSMPKALRPRRRRGVEAL